MIRPDKIFMCRANQPAGRQGTTMKFSCFALLYFLFAIQQNGSAQQSKTVSVMDFVKIKNGKKTEALYYYENNWKVYREAAVERGLIHFYQLMMVTPDSLNNYDLILITTYKDSPQYLKSEENFQPILKELRPNGPKLLKEVKPADFRQNVFAKITQPVFHLNLYLKEMTK